MTRHMALLVATLMIPAAASSTAATQHPAGHASPQGAPHAPGDETSHIETWLDGYDAAFIAKDLEKLATYYHPDVTIYEGGGINNGWADYRDHHLKPEIDEMKNVKYQLTDITTRTSGDTAWATFKYALSADLKERHVEANGLGTAVLEKRGSDWKIVHWHTSASRRKPAEKKP